MKYFILLLVIFIVSCSNQKAVIVEQIKQQKDSLIVAQMNISGYQYAAKHVLLIKKLTKSDSTFLKEQNFTLVNYNSLDSMRQVWWVKSLNPTNKIDSLELELKKY